MPRHARKPRMSIDAAPLRRALHREIIKGRLDQCRGVPTATATSTASELVGQRPGARPQLVLDPHVQRQQEVPEACQQGDEGGGGDDGKRGGAMEGEQGMVRATSQASNTAKNDAISGPTYTPRSARCPLPPRKYGAPPRLPRSTRSRKDSGLVLLRCDASAGLAPSCSGEGPAAGLVAVTEQPMMRPWRRTPRYHCGPMRFSCTSVNPAAVNHCRQAASQQAAQMAGGRAGGRS